MPKKEQKLKPDTVVKNYWRDNGQFADFFNAVLFGGRQVIQPEELVDADTEESSVLEHREYAESIQAARDIIKIRKKSLAQGAEFVMLAQEGQEHVHYAMPMRVMGYDYGTYKKQYEDNAKKYKKPEGMSQDEFLSRMCRADKFVPVITVVVYYGERPWDGATNLHGMLDIGEELAPYVSDYKMLLVEARKNNLKFHHANNVDFFRMLEILLDRSKPLREAKKEAIEYAKEHKVDKSVVMTVAGAANCNIDYNGFREKGEAGMWAVFEETWAEGRAEGRAEGIIEAGFELGLSEHDILERLQDRLNIPMQKAQEYFNMFGKQPV